MIARRLFGTAAVALFVSLAAIGNVNGGLIIEARVDGGSWVTIASGLSGTSVTGSYSDVSGVFFDTLKAKSNSPGSSPSSKLIETAFSLENTSNLSHIVEIRTGDTGYNFPDVTESNGRVGLTSSIGGTLWDGTSLTLSHQLWVDATNSQQGQSGATITPASGQLITSAVNGGGFQFSAKDESQYVLGRPFSMTTLTTITLAANSSAGFQSSASVYAVPEPSSVLSWSAAGMMLLGIAVHGVKRASCWPDANARPLDSQSADIITSLASEAS